MTTKVQAAILEFIKSYQARKLVPPSSREVQRQFGFLSQTTAIRHLRALAAKGLIEQMADRRWGIMKRESSMDSDCIPLYGSIPSGAPKFTEQQPEELLPFDTKILRTRHPVWAVRVQGDSMIGAHIMDGDVAILEKRDPAPGDIVAALVDNTDTTLKRYVIVEGRPLLRAANEKYPDIYPQSLESQGVLIALFRRQDR